VPNDGPQADREHDELLTVWSRSQSVRDGHAMTRAILPGERGVPPPTLCLLALLTTSKKHAVVDAAFAPDRAESREEGYRGEDKRLPRLVFALPAPVSFDRAAEPLRCQPLLARPGARLGWPALLRPPGGLLKERDEPPARGGPILQLRPMLPTVDEQHAAGRHAVSSQRDHPLLHLGWQRRRANVEAQFDRGRDFVDVLAAWSRGADEALLDVAIIDGHRLGDSHGATLSGRTTAGPKVQVSPRKLETRRRADEAV
jgi:hypothetical protein